MADVTRIEKLNDENYIYWRMEAQGILVEKGAWDAIDPGYGAEPTAAQKKADHKAKTMLYLMIDKASKNDIMECQTAKEVWDTLEKVHTKYDLWHGALIVKEYVLETKKENESMVNYLARRHLMYKKVKDAGFVLPEKVQCVFAILGLPEDYEFLCRTLKSGDDGEVSDMTQARIKAKLIEEERRLKNKDRKNDTEVEALRGRKKASRKTARHTSESDSSDDGQYDHSRHPKNQERGSRIDRRSKQRNQTRRREYSHEQKKNSPRREERTSERQRDKKGREAICYECGQKGHFKFECPKNRLRTRKAEKKDGQPTSDTDESKENQGDSSWSSEEENIRKVTATTKNAHGHSNERKKKSISEGTAMLATERMDGNHTWVLDSGATSHMCKNPGMMENLQDANQRVWCANGHSLTANGAGKVELNLMVKNEPHHLELANVLLMPGIRANLISVSALMDAKLRVKLFKNHAYIIGAKGVILGKGKRIKGLYVFKHKVEQGKKIE
jgi:hypothetical protein